MAFSGLFICRFYEILIIRMIPFLLLPPFQTKKKQQQQHSTHRREGKIENKI